MNRLLSIKFTIPFHNEFRYKKVYFGSLSGTVFQLIYINQLNFIH